MRTAFIEALTEVAASDPRIWLVTGDLGYSVLERFAERFPDRYLNAGVAEQNMTGIAAGLAMSGKVVFTYSIANFPTFRCLEQIRNDVCYHKLNVKVVSVGGGYSYPTAGYTHHGVEDYAIMSALPGMTVVAPGDPVETRLAVRAIAQSPGPCFLRLGKAGEPTVHLKEPSFALGKMIVLRQGPDATIISTGALLDTCRQAVEKLAALNIRVTLLSCPTLVPLDEETLIREARATGAVVTVEGHGPGGLGSLIGEALARHRFGGIFHPIHYRREPLFRAGTQESLRAQHGVSVESIVAAVQGMR